jgi:hypothetical protein
MRLRLILAALAASLLLPGSAGAMIQMDKGIAGVRLNNTRDQVRAALGTPTKINSGTNEFGQFVEYRFAGGIRVLFQGGEQVSLVSTTGLGDRTTRGVGVGSTERAVRTKVPGVKCETIGGVRSCHTGAFAPGKVVTDFALNAKKRVTRVTVGIVID